MQIHFNPDKSKSQNEHSDPGLKRVLDSLTKTIERDALVRETTTELRTFLQVDRVVLYYFYTQWDGQVTFESLSSKEFSILGSTGGADCFKDEYAALYLAGRTRAIGDIELEDIQPCHRDFLRSLQVRANLVVPVLIPRGLWGLLVAHHCQQPRSWTSSDIEMMLQGAETLATAPCILES